MTDTATIESPEVPVSDVPEGFNRYTVVAAAVTIVTGQKANGQPETTRLVKDDTIVAEPGNESIKTLLGFRAIIRSEKLADGRVRVLTPRAIFEVQKKSGEGTAEAKPEFAALPAPASEAERV